MFSVEKTKTGARINGRIYTFEELADERAIDKVETDTGLSRIASAHAVSIALKFPKSHVLPNPPLTTR